MSEGPEFRPLMAALSQASIAMADLAQVACEGGLGCRTMEEDTIPCLADALKLTIEYAIAAGEGPSDQEGQELLGQLQGGLTRFLEGWA